MRRRLVLGSVTLGLISALAFALFSFATYGDVAESAPVVTKTVRAKREPNFQPATVTIKKGQRVKWVVADGLPHTVTKTTGPGARFDRVIDPDAPRPARRTFTKTFNLVGTYNYICEFHSNMKGKVIVTP